MIAGFQDRLGADPGKGARAVGKFGLADTVIANFEERTIAGTESFDLWDNGQNPGSDGFVSQGTMAQLVSNPANLGQSQPAGSAYLLPVSEDSFKPFRMKVRVDNQKSTAVIYNILVDGVASSTECGFVKYKDKGTSDVNFRLRASHPNDFATFNFNVVRGNSADPLSSADTAGMVGASTANYTLGADEVYRNAVNVGYLLGTCPDKAAFAEHLYVNGLHTNGTSILDTFDASALAAFALEPE